jgi:hypothetical protein
MSSSGWGIVNDLEQLAEVEQPDFLKPDRINLELFTDKLTGKGGRARFTTLDARRHADGNLVADPQGLARNVMKLAHNAVQQTVRTTPSRSGDP